MAFHRPSAFVHVVYRTRRFSEMLHWYETVFGARIQHKNPALAFMTYDEEHHRFAFVNMAVLAPDGAETERQGSTPTASALRRAGEIAAMSSPQPRSRTRSGSATPRA